MTDRKSTIRDRLIASAVELFMNDSRPLCAQEVCSKSGVEQDKLLLFFDSSAEILESVYLDALREYRAMLPLVDGFEQSSLQEKFSNFAYVMFGLLDKRREFVRASFDEVIVQHPSKSRFHEELEQLFMEFLMAEDSTTSSGWESSEGGLRNQNSLVLYINIQLIIDDYFGLIKFWLLDNSDYLKRTASYIDQLVVFWADSLDMDVPDEGLFQDTDPSLQDAEIRT